jgi:hypothetical protein
MCDKADVQQPDRADERVRLAQLNRPQAEAVRRFVFYLEIYPRIARRPRCEWAQMLHHLRILGHLSKRLSIGVRP